MLRELKFSEKFRSGRSAVSKERVVLLERVRSGAQIVYSEVLGGKCGGETVRVFVKNW